MVERGSLEDWRLLEALHYKHGAITPGSHYYKMTLDGETIGVLMMAAPKLLLKERHVMFPKLKPGHDTKFSNTARMKWINANMAIVSRVVVDTMYRSAGLAYRFTNIACRMDPKQYIEIQSAMSKYNQFAQKAGFRFCPPIKSNKFHEGIRFFASTFNSEPADLEAILIEIESLPPAQRENVIAECRLFYARHSMLENTGKALIKNADGVKFSDSRIARLPVRELLTQIIQMTLAAPLYGVYINPDVGRTMPDRIPLLAFDNQAVTEPLKIP
jgi:ABC-type ATPase with predicted acetyltransferase domain